MYGFDGLGEICFSSRLGFLDTSSDVGGIVKDIEQEIHMASVVGQVPRLNKLLTKN